MEGNMTNASMLNNKKVVPSRPDSGGRKTVSRENKLSKMDSAEFLWMLGGAAVVGTGMYLLSFLMI